MSELPVPLKEGELIPDQAQSLRLSDAEKIAAERLDSGGEDRPSNPSPPALSEESASQSVRLTDRIDDLLNGDNEPSLSGAAIGVAAESSDKMGDAFASDLGALHHDEEQVIHPAGAASEHGCRRGNPSPARPCASECDPSGQ